MIVWTDGAARGNPGPAGAGALITDDDGLVLGEIAAGLGVATNNVAEYTAAILGLEGAAELGAREVLLRSDSRLVIEQLAGRWKIRNPTLRELHARATEIARRFSRITYEHVRRERNMEADRLANAGVDAWLAGD